MVRKEFGIFIIAFLFMFFMLPVEAATLLDAEDEYVIVIDPGHGGENLGTISNENFDEKEITMKTAQALVDELSKYEGVKVYMTRKDDKDLSLEKRAEFAERVGADFLFSIHYNASENHTSFGSEVWIPLEAPYHAPAYQFAYLQQLEMQELGLFIRGIKTRIGEDGTDYYGIIRESVERDIPAVIIEHCYVDELRDSEYCDSDEDFAEFGRRDAEAIAQFLGLEAYEGPEELLELSEEDTVSDTYADNSAPDICQLEMDNWNSDNNLLTITVTASDRDTPLLYYSYSVDGGNSFGALYPWPGSNMLTGTYDDNFSLMLEISPEQNPEIVLRAYNKFEFYTESNPLSLTKDFFEAENAQAAGESELVEVDLYSASSTDSEEEEVFDFETFLLLTILAVLGMLFVILLYGLLCNKGNIRKHNE